MEIGIKDSQRKITINKKDTTHLAKQILRIKGKKCAELSILFVGKTRIRGLNKKFRKIDRPTDVLAFGQNVEEKNLCLHPALPKIRKLSVTKNNWAASPLLLRNIRKLRGKGKGGVNPEILGDVVICPEIAQDEIYLCLLHGILHLLGYDDSNAKNRTLLEREQTRILKKIKKDEKTEHCPKL